MRKLCACDIDDDRITLLKDRPKLAISQIRCDNSSNRLDSYFTYILKHSINNKNRYRIGKLFSHGDEGVFSNDKPCILSLKDKHFYNIWGYDFCLMILIPLRLVLNKHVAVLPSIRNYFVCTVWFLIPVIACTFVVVGATVA